MRIRSISDADVTYLKQKYDRALKTCGGDITHPAISRPKLQYEMAKEIHNLFPHYRKYKDYYEKSKI